MTGAAALAVVVGAGCTGHGKVDQTARPATSISSATTSTTAGPDTQPSTTTTLDPGVLPQTTVHPRGTDPALAARIQLLWQAVVAGTPGTARPAFFPLSAYRQVKARRDPAGDWQNRLVATYNRDLLVLHRSLGGAPATFVALEVPDGAAVWVRPGQEFNKLGYWRVYGAQVRYRVRGQLRTFPIASLISWRGQWYVVHLNQLSR